MTVSCVVSRKPLQTESIYLCPSTVSHVKRCSLMLPLYRRNGLFTRIPGVCYKTPHSAYHVTPPALLALHTSLACILLCPLFAFISFRCMRRISAHTDSSMKERRTGPWTYRLRRCPWITFDLIRKPDDPCWIWDMLFISEVGRRFVGLPADSGWERSPGYG